MKQKKHKSFFRWRNRATVLNRGTILGFLKGFGIVIGAFFILFFILNWIFPLPDKIEYSIIITDSKDEVINAYLTKGSKMENENRAK
jgi:penicillin-binding protein 1C